jgi:hypothetical protein
MPRSLKIRPDRIPTIKSTLLRNGFPSQRILAEHLEIAQSTVSSFLNGKPVDYLNFLELCRVLGQEWQDIADLEGQASSETSVIAKATIAIAFPPNLRELAMQLQQALTPVGHVMLIYEKDSPLSEQLKQTDYLLLLLSEQSLFSEVLLENVRLAKELRDSTEKPALFPICIDFPANLPLSFDLLGYLQDVQPWQWRSANDISVLVSALQHILQEQRIALPANHKLVMHWAAITASFHPDNPPQNSPTLSLPSNPPLPTAAPEIPGGQMDVASAFYIDRPPIEARSYEAIAQPGALIRIKAPRQMGKTSLMAKILHHAQQQGSKTVALSLQLANQRVFGNSDTFLQWFCASVSLELGLLDSEQLAKYWKLAEMIGSNQSCKAYFEQYLLPELSAPLTLGLDEVDRVFSSLEIADDFFGLLRALHEEAKRREIWKNFRLIVVHSTEVYIPLDINKSPFNVGLPVELPEFTSAQVQELARRYRLDWTMEQVQQLMALVGGHPYLVRLAMYAIARQDITLNELLQSAPTESGIYSDHLRRHLGNLKHHPTLLEAFREVISSQSSVRLPSEQAFKLSSIGLVKLDKNEVTPRCHLYRQYFQERL